MTGSVNVKPGGIPKGSNDYAPRHVGLWGLQE